MGQMAYWSLAGGLLLAVGVADRLAAAEGDAELVKFTEEALKYDANNDGLLKDAELVVAGERYPQAILKRLFDVLRQDGESDKEGRISATARLKALTQSERRRVVRTSCFDNEAWEFDGRLVRHESLCPLKQANSDRLFISLFHPRDVILMALLRPQGNGTEIPDTIAVQVDQNHNGYLEPAEIKAAEPLLVKQFDADGDGELSTRERRNGSAEAYFQDGLFRLCPEADQNQDGWLSAAEMAVALAQVMPIYDVDKNGRLDVSEETMVIRDGMYAWPHRMKFPLLTLDLDTKITVTAPAEWEQQILALALAKYGAPGATTFGLPEIFRWRRQAECKLMTEYQGTVVEWSRKQLEKQMGPALDEPARLALWKKRLAVYDSNHDGMLTVDECRHLWQGEFIPGTVNIESIGTYIHWDYFSEFYAYVAKLVWYPAANVFVAVDRDLDTENWRAVLPGLFAKIDTNGDGLFSPAEALAMEPRMDERKREETIRRAVETFLRVTLQNPISKKQISAEVDRLKPHFDLDHDGKFNPAELRSLLAEVEGRTRDRVQSLWLERFTDIDGDGRVSAGEKLLAVALMRFCYDRDGDGVFDADEVSEMHSDYDQQDQYNYQRQQRLEADRKQLPRYDLDGDGKLSPAERARSEADVRRQLKSGITTPPQDD